MEQRKKRKKKEEQVRKEEEDSLTEKKEKLKSSAKGARCMVSVLLQFKGQKCHTSWGGFVHDVWHRSYHPKTTLIRRPAISSVYR